MSNTYESSELFRTAAWVHLYICIEEDGAVSPRILDSYMKQVYLTVLWLIHNSIFVLSLYRLVRLNESEGNRQRVRRPLSRMSSDMRDSGLYLCILTCVTVIAVSLTVVRPLSNLIFLPGTFCNQTAYKLNVITWKKNKVFINYWTLSFAHHQRPRLIWIRLDKELLKLYYFNFSLNVIWRGEKLFAVVMP